MSRQNFNDGQEIIQQDFNDLQARQQQEMYDRIVFEMLSKQENGFFGDSHKVNFLSSNTVTILPGSGFQTDTTVALAEPTKRPFYLAASTVRNLAAADATNDRIDIVIAKTVLQGGAGESRNFKNASTETISSESLITTLDWASDIQVIQGVAGPAPLAPAVPAGYIQLAAVFVTANVGVVDANSITDSRQIMPLGGEVTTRTPNRLVKTNPQGFLDNSFMGGVASFATEAEAIAAGLNFEGAQYFNTTAKVLLMWLDDPNGNGAPASFVRRHVRQDHISLFSSSGQVFVSGISAVMVLDGVLSNFYGNYNTTTGEYTVPDSGIYSVQYNFGVFQNAGGTGHLAQGFIDASGPVTFRYEGTQFNTSSTQVNSLSTSSVVFSRFLPAGTIITARGLQINAQGTNLSVGPGLRTFLSITRIA